MSDLPCPRWPHRGPDGACAAPVCPGAEACKAEADAAIRRADDELRRRALAGEFDEGMGAETARRLFVDGDAPRQMELFEEVRCG